MTINIRPIENVELYVFGSWTSESALYALHGFPSDTDPSWGLLSWDEENTGASFSGSVRIDLLDAAGNVLIGDIARNPDGSGTDLSATVAAAQDLKIRVKLYGRSDPTPKVSNIRLSRLNWSSGLQLVSNSGKDCLLNRAYLASPSATAISTAVFGASQTSNFTEDSTALAQKVSLATTPTNSLVYNSSNSSVILEHYLAEDETVVPNGTKLNAIGLQNTDISPLFCAGVRFADILKSRSLRYHFYTTLRVVPLQGSTSMLTMDGRMMLINRATAASPSFVPPTRIYAGSTPALDKFMTSITDLVGPINFTYTLQDTSNHKLLLRATVDKDTGNGQVLTSASCEGADGSFYFANSFDRMTKSGTYVYMYTFNWNCKTPQAGTI